MSIKEVEYVTETDRIKLRTHTGDGRPAQMLLTPSDTTQLINKLMSAVHEAKLAARARVKPAPPAPKPKPKPASKRGHDQVVAPVAAPDPARPLARRLKDAKPRI